VDHLHRLTGSVRRTSRKAQQLKQANLTLELKISGALYGPGHRDRLRLEFFYEHVDVWSRLILQIDLRNSGCQLAFRKTCGGNVIVPHWHPDHAPLIHSNSVSRQFRGSRYAHLKHIAWTNPITAIHRRFLRIEVRRLQGNNGHEHQQTSRKCSGRTS
jgi:hypothetical protein